MILPKKILIQNYAAIFYKEAIIFMLKIHIINASETGLKTINSAN
jgi:hypothetical protein